jgi:hypothetical protein
VIRVPALFPNDRRCVAADNGVALANGFVSFGALYGIQTLLTVPAQSFLSNIEEANLHARIAD